uniref:LIM zinc-binding domain-containing protein n=1 Tax=Papio anubis TaxID=9555 RepID=A0A8I5R5V2_PAPAN
MTRRGFSRAGAAQRSTRPAAEPQPPAARARPRRPGVPGPLRRREYLQLPARRREAEGLSHQDSEEGAESGARPGERGADPELGRPGLRTVSSWRLGWHFDFGVAAKPGVKMTERFDCHHCNESLFGKKYILREESPYCVACFETLFANTCEECGKPIGCDCKDLSYKDRHWHEACFHCSQCRNSLVDKPFAAKEDQLLCTDCYSNEYSSKCQECKKTIMPGTRKMEYKGSSWHETCFICHRCQQPIGTKSFIPKDNQNFCVPCYEKQHAMQCVQCKKDLAAQNTSPLRNGSGITTALTVRSAPSHWWGVASSQRGTTSCAPTVGKTSEVNTEKLLLVISHTDFYVFFLTQAILPSGFFQPHRDFLLVLFSDTHICFNPLVLCASSVPGKEKTRPRP